MTTARLNHAVFSSRSDEWESPDVLVRALAERYGDGAFALDAAATAENAKAERFYDIETDALDRDWHADAAGGAIWLNPPYSRVKDFLARAAETARAGTTVVALVPARTDTAWWHGIVLARAAEVLLVRGRISFARPSGNANAAPFPSAVVVFRPHTTCLPRFGVLHRDGSVGPVQS